MAEGASRPVQIDKSKADKISQVQIGRNWSQIEKDQDVVDKYCIVMDITFQRTFLNNKNQFS